MGSAENTTDKLAEALRRAHTKLSSAMDAIPAARTVLQSEALEAIEAALAALDAEAKPAPADPLWNEFTLDEVKARLQFLNIDDLRGLVVSLLIQWRIEKRAYAAAPAAPAQEPLTDAALRDAQEQPFEDWWEREGQFVRSGGGDYEKSFAWQAWIAASIGKGGAA